MTIVKYTIGEDVDKILKNVIYESIAGKTDFEGPEPKKSLDIKSGLAGFRQLNNAIRDMAMKSGLVINVADMGIISGKSTNLDIGYSYIQYAIPFLANVKIILDPTMDPVVDSDKKNPFINGFRLSSYNYKVFDGDVCIIELIAKVPKYSLLKKIKDFLLKPIYSALDIIIIITVAASIHGMKWYYRLLGYFIGILIMNFYSKSPKK